MEKQVANLSGSGCDGPRTSIADEGSFLSSFELKENTFIEARVVPVVAKRIKYISASIVLCLMCGHSAQERKWSNSEGLNNLASKNKIRA